MRVYVTSCTAVIFETDGFGAPKRGFVFCQIRGLYAHRMSRKRSLEVNKVLQEDLVAARLHFECRGLRDFFLG